MAKKPKTPPPPRRPVQAPKARTGRESTGGPRVPVLWIVLGAALLAAIIGVGAFMAARGGGEDVTAASFSKDCRLKTVKALSQKHVPIGAHVTYNTTPPSSGPHANVAGEAPAVWDFYDVALPPVRVVHNLEHGGVVIWYGSKVSPATREKLRTFYDESPDAMLGTLYPKLGSKIALTAWTSGADGKNQKGRVLTCTRFNADDLQKFRDAFRGRGPEGFPTEANKPGT